MLTSFFGKSNPINYLILGILIFVGYFLAIFSEIKSAINVTFVLEHIVFCAVSVLSMLLLDFIIRKNNLTKNNTFGIFFFTFFLLAIPPVFLEGTILITNIFILLALRRILSFRTNKNIEKKILDAAIWITVASFFYFWSLLFFFVLFFALLRKPNTNYKELLIPIIGFLGILVLVTAYYFLVTNSFSWFFDWKTPISKDFFAYNGLRLLVPAAIMITFLIWAGLSRVFKISVLQKKERSNAVIILIAVVTTIFMALDSPQKTGAEMLFIIGPLAMISNNYIESSKEIWFKEVLLWLAVLLPILVFIL
jgi:hypothetical protein